jgi:hypothetical protein
MLQRAIGGLANAVNYRTAMNVFCGAPSSVTSVSL